MTITFFSRWAKAPFFSCLPSQSQSQASGEWDFFCWPATGNDNNDELTFSIVDEWWWAESGFLRESTCVRLRARAGEKRVSVFLFLFLLKLENIIEQTVKYYMHYPTYRRYYVNNKPRVVSRSWWGATGLGLRWTRKQLF